jgi:TonB family protein
MRTGLLKLFLPLLGFLPLAIAQDSVPERVQVPNDVIRGLLLNRIAPKYPPLARQARIQGTVVLNVFINKSGEVESVRLTSGHPMLAPAAIAAVKQWRYQPYLQDGEPVEVETTIQVNFQLSESAVATAGDHPGGLPPGNFGAIAIPPGIPRVPEASMRKLRIQQVDSIYPLAALQAHVEGMVVLNALIDKFGDVEQLALISGHPLLAPAAIEAVRKWRYQPYLINDAPADVQSTIQINFTISSGITNSGSTSDGN